MPSVPESTKMATARRKTTREAKPGMNPSISKRGTKTKKKSSASQILRGPALVFPRNSDHDVSKKCADAVNPSGREDSNATYEDWMRVNASFWFLFRFAPQIFAHGLAIGRHGIERERDAALSRARWYC